MACYSQVLALLNMVSCFVHVCLSPRAVSDVSPKDWEAECGLGSTQQLCFFGEWTVYALISATGVQVHVQHTTHTTTT